MGATAENIKACFEHWNHALATGDPEVVADCYAPDAVLVPTVSNRIRTDREGIVDYFRHFLARGPRGHITADSVLEEGELVIHNGVYEFTFADGSVVPARFTFVYRAAPDGWRILTHHSSALPESG